LPGLSARNPKHEALLINEVGKSIVLICGVPDQVLAIPENGSCCHSIVSQVFTEILANNIDLAKIPDSVRTEICEKISHDCMKKGLSRDELSVVLATEIVNYSKIN